MSDMDRYSDGKFFEDERVAIDTDQYDPYYDDPQIETEEDRW